VCHGAAGKGKDDLIEKGRRKMTGESDRVSSEMAWKLVNYVRSFAKKDTVVIPKPGESR